MQQNRDALMLARERILCGGALKLYIVVCLVLWLEEDLTDFITVLIHRSKTNNITTTFCFCFLAHFPTGSQTVLKEVTMFSKYPNVYSQTSM